MENETKIVDLTEQTNDNIQIIEDNDSKQQIEILEQELEEWKTKYKYLLADLENTKKRYQTILGNCNKYKEEYIAMDLVEILDDFERIINNQFDKEGIKLVYNKFIDILNNYEILPIYKDKRDVYFNSKFDEAIGAMQTNDKTLNNTINKVINKGYYYKDKILRYEKVYVNTYIDLPITTT